MTANASWSVVPAPLSTSNARWGIASGGSTDASPGGPLRKDNIFLNRMLPSKTLKKQDGVSSMRKLDTSSLLGLPGKGKKLSTAVSTSALSHMGTGLPLSSGDGGTTGKLRDETLRSLGIAVPARKQPLRSALKKEGGGMSRNLTMACIREVEICLPNYKTIKRNTSINFKEQVKVRKIPSSSSLVDDKKELWFQDDEMKTIRQKAKSMASMAEINGASDEAYAKTGESIRGLERYLDDGRRTKTRRNKFQVWDAVLDEQEQQIMDGGGEYDAERIARVCRSISMDSLHEAQRRAQQDAVVAQRLMAEAN